MLMVAFVYFPQAMEEEFARQVANMQNFYAGSLAISGSQYQASTL